MWQYFHTIKSWAVAATMTGHLPKLSARPSADTLFVLRAALASVGAVGSAQLLGLPYPIYALLAAVLVLDRSPLTTRQNGIYRLLGSVLGTLVGAALSSLFGHALWVLGIAVLLALTLCRIFGLTEAAKLAGYVAGIVVLDHSGQPWTYAVYRCLETMLGIASALLVALAFVPLYRRWSGEGDSDQVV
jgi:uncharacterized membrane protein YgaE (UPF0421/DUF939 family)